MQLGVIGLDRARLALARRDSVAAGIVHECVRGHDIVGVVLGGLEATLDELLRRLRGRFPEDIPAEDPARGAVYHRDHAGNVT